MAQRTFHETAHDGRSVLGMLEVQVERDPKTGATVVRSVAPVSAPAGAPDVATVFDDGRKSIHAVGRAAGQPSSEELGQILNVIDGVGMRVLLDEVTVTPTKADVKAEEEGGAREAFDTEAPPFTLRPAASKEENTQFERFGDDQVEAEETHATMVVRDVAEQVDHIEERRLEEGPVTLMFLGYADATSGGDDAGEDEGGVIAVERVIITEDGEELLMEPQTAAAPESDRAAEQHVGKDRRGFQDVPLDANGGGGEVMKEDGDKVPPSASPSKAAEEGKAKRKTCQCCSIM